MELRPAELLKRWKAGQFAPVYYLVGEELSAKSDALARLKQDFKADDFNLREFSGDVDQDAAAIVAEAATLPVFSDRRLVIVKNPKIPAAAKAAFAEYLKDPLKSTTLVLLCDDRRPDPKDPLAKAAEALGGLCLFSPLGEDEARAKLSAEAARHGKTLSPDAAAVLISEAGTEWAILSQELEKLVLFVDKAADILADDVLACLGYRKAANPWTISDLVERRDLKGALAQLQSLFKDGKPDEQARGALYKIRDVVSRQLKARRMQRAQVPTDAIARSVRLFNPRVAQEFLARVAKLPEARLRRDLKRCVRAETDLNSKTWLDVRMEVERLLIDLCKA
jgi:DNA polymerase III subunit delta